MADVALGAKQPPRLLAVDAIRGIAAMAVVLYHVPLKLREAIGVPHWLDAVFASGFYGVDAFFVLSGFVMTMSVSAGDWRPSYLPRFMLRRSLRLDPAYWLAIVFELALGWVGVHLLADAYEFPNWRVLGAHIFYLQGLFGYEQVSDAFWTLCFEVQFYLLLVSTLVLAGRFTRTDSIRFQILLGATLAAFIVWSLLMRSGSVPNPNSGLVVQRLYQFGLGILVYLLASQKGPKTLLKIAILSIVAARLLEGAMTESIVIVTAAAVCGLSLRSLAINRWCDASVVQFLGKISYSLYLYHASIVGRAAAVALILHNKFGYSMILWFGLAAAISGSVVFSYLVYTFVEKPTANVAKRISLPMRLR